MATSDKPILSSVLNRLYNETFRYLDHEDSKKEKSASEALLLLSANFLCTNNPYYRMKINEIYESVENCEEKWIDDLWYPALVKFAYDNKEMDRDGATKVLKNFMKIWMKKNPGVARNVTIANILTLKRGLATSGIHLSHASVFEFLVKGCPAVNNLPTDTISQSLSIIVEKLVAKLPHHLSHSPANDPLFEANNYFILKHYKACQLQLVQDFRKLESQLTFLENSRSSRPQEAIMRQVTAHHEFDGILVELCATSLEWKDMRGLQMQIVRSFTNIARTRFFARYPTAMLFRDIDEQIFKYSIDVTDLAEKYNNEVTFESREFTANESDDDDYDDDSDAGLVEDGSVEEGDQEFDSENEQENEEVDDQPALVSHNDQDSDDEDEDIMDEGDINIGRYAKGV